MEKGLLSRQPDLSCEWHCSLSVSQMLVQVSASRGEEKVSAAFVEKTFGQKLNLSRLSKDVYEKGLFSRQPDLSLRMALFIFS